MLVQNPDAALQISNEYEKLGVKSRLRFVLLLRDPADRAFTWFRWHDTAPRRYRTFSKYIRAAESAKVACVTDGISDARLWPDCFARGETGSDSKAVDDREVFAGHSDRNASRELDESGGDGLSHKLFAGIYVQQLRHWLRYFDASQFLVMSLPALRAPGGLGPQLAEVQDFLEFPARDLGRAVLEHANTAPAKRKSEVHRSRADMNALAKFFERYNEELFQLLSDAGIRVAGVPNSTVENLRAFFGFRRPPPSQNSTGHAVK